MHVVVVAAAADKISQRNNNTTLQLPIEQVDTVTNTTATTDPVLIGTYCDGPYIQNHTEIYILTFYLCASLISDLYITRVEYSVWFLLDVYAPYSGS